MEGIQKRKRRHTRRPRPRGRAYRDARRIETQHINIQAIQSVNLPWDIIFIILSKLPTKSLMKFLCVSKKFYGLIKDPKFIDLQLENALQQPPSFILYETDEYTRVSRPFNAIRNFYLVQKGKYKSKATKIPANDKLCGYLQITGSCNGLLCLLRSKTEYRSRCDLIIIYNPITQERETIIPPEVYVYDSVSFCFDANSNKYKVVTIGWSRKSFTCMDVYIFTIGESCWRKINLPYRFEFMEYIRGYRNSVFFNGALYWIIKKYDNESVPVTKVLSMDISEEKFTEIDCIDPLIGKANKPRRYHSEEYHVSYLVSYVKDLALIVYNPQHNQEMQIWLLVDSEKGIWIHHSTNDMLSFVEGNARSKLNDHNFNGFDCRIEGMVGDDGLLLEYFDDNESDDYNIMGPGKHHLVHYIPKSGKFDFKFLSSGTKIPRNFDVVSFVPTLVSLK
ncbi:F-box protein [Thalictrum thalictroides]|uniref:F-box protein n=1 Tax=Thalictrum thalictroides TaxID=46969 RepID=A0A7J6WRH3_THATH|nr:F-box protein [Thalictrum thalictroides]